MELPEIPGPQERVQARIPQLEEASEKKLVRSATKQTPSKHKRKASEAVDLLYKRQEGQWNETPLSTRRSKVHFNTLGPFQAALGLQESSPDEKSQNSEFQNPTKKIEAFQP